MDLQTVIENTPKILGETAAFTALTYPIFLGLKSMISRKTFMGSLKGSGAYGIGFGIGWALLQYGRLLFK